MGRHWAKTYFTSFSLLAVLLLSACTRNPLGEELATEILNQDFSLTQNCLASTTELTPFSCQPATSTSLTNVTWKLEYNNTCLWASINSSTGEITGLTPAVVISDTCNLVVSARSDKRVSMPLTIPLLITSRTPTISYSGSYIFLAGLPVTPPITPSLSDGVPTNCVSTPSLPVGLSINPTTCVISGIPTLTTPQQDFTITASNVYGGKSATVRIGVIPAEPNNISLAGVYNFTTSACSLFTITVRDALGNVSSVSSDTHFNLSSSDPSGSFYSDASCSVPVTGIVVLNGTIDSSFFFRKTVPGTSTISVSLNTPLIPAISGVSRSVNTLASTPARLGLVVPATGTTDSCNSIDVNLLDSNSMPVNSGVARTVNLSGTGSSIFYSNPSCGSVITSTVIAIGTNTTTVYMRKITSGTATLTASSAGVGSGSGSIVVSVAPANRLVFSTVATSPYATSTCQSYTIQSKDSLNNNVSPVTADTTVSLSGVSDGSFYSNSTCSAGNQITSTIILNGTSSKTIYFSKPTTTASVPGVNIVLRASVVGWSPDATTSVNVSTGVPTHIRASNSTGVGLAILSATNVTIGNRCLLTTLQIRDEANVVVPASAVASPITTSLSGGGAGAQFWSNSACTTPISTMTFNAGVNSRNIYYSSSTTTPTVAFNWSNGGLSGSGGSRNVTVTNGVPSRLTWTTAPAASVNVNTCQSFAMNVRDANMVTAIGAKVAVATDFQLSDGADGIFYRSAGCVNPVTSIQIPANGQSVPFYYRKSTAGAVTVSVSLQNPLTPAISTLTRAVNFVTPPLVPNNILITATPTVGLISNQSCSALTLQSRNGVTPANVTANSTFTLSATNSAQFYLDSGCTAPAPVASMIISNGTNSASGLYIKSPNAGAVTVGGTGPITVGNLLLNYSAPPPTMLALVGPGLIYSGISCGNFAIYTQDALGTNQNVLSSTVVTISSTGAQPIQFYSDSMCTIPLSGNQVTINTGTNSSGFYVRATIAGTAQVQITAPGLTSASQNMTVQ